MIIKKTLLFMTALGIFCLVQSGTLFHATAAENRVFDEAGLFTEQERTTLQEAIDDAIENTGMDLAVLTTEDAKGKTTEQYADDYYEENGLGIGEDFSGALCLIDMDNRELTISTEGDMIRVLTDARIESILDHAIGFVGDGDYAAGAETMLRDISNYVQAGVPDGQFNYDRDTGEVSVYRKRSVAWYEALFALGVAGTVACLACVSVVRKYRMESERRQALNYRFAYKAASAFAFSVATDFFVDRAVSQRRIVQSSSRSSGGSSSSSSGRSTTHRSSSGRSHGGGSRKF